MQPQRSGIYCRLSYAPDGSLEKVERQEADCRKVAKRLGWSVADVYPDNSRSAWHRNRKRPQWDRMLADIESGRIDAIVVYHGDRLIRQPYDLELLLQLADDRRVPLASPSGTRDLSSEDDRFVLRVEAAQACKSSADTSRRVLRAWETKAERGEAVGCGLRPFGYGIPTGATGRTGKPLYDLHQIVPGEADVLREAADRLLAGQTLGGVVRWMNTCSTTTQGNPWLPVGLKKVLTAPRVAGLLVYQGQTQQAAWPPILEPEVWEDVKAVFRRSRERHGYFGRERSYLLSSIAECSGCGSTMPTKVSGGRNRKDARLYFCPNSECDQRVSRNVEHLDAYVIGRVLKRLNEPGFLDAMQGERLDPGVGADIAALERRKAEARAQLANLADHPDVSADLVARSLSSFDRKITELREQQELTARDRLLARMAGMTQERWDAEPIDVRAETVRALFRVVVLPATWRGPGFDPESVRLDRR